MHFVETGLEDDGPEEDNAEREDAGVCNVPDY